MAEILEKVGDQQIITPWPQDSRMVKVWSTCSIQLRTCSKDFARPTFIVDSHSEFGQAYLPTTKAIHAVPAGSVAWRTRGWDEYEDFMPYHWYDGPIWRTESHHKFLEVENWSTNQKNTSSIPTRDRHVQVLIHFLLILPIAKYSSLELLAWIRSKDVEPRDWHEWCTHDPQACMCIDMQHTENPRHGLNMLAHHASSFRKHTGNKYKQWNRFFTMSKFMSWKDLPLMEALAFKTATWKISDHQWFINHSSSSPFSKSLGRSQQRCSGNPLGQLNGSHWISSWLYSRRAPTKRMVV